MRVDTSVLPYGRLQRGWGGGGFSARGRVDRLPLRWVGGEEGGFSKTAGSPLGY